MSGLQNYLDERAAMRPLDTEADWIAAGNPPGVLENRALIELHAAGEGCRRWWGQANGVAGNPFCLVCDDPARARGFDENGKEKFISNAEAIRQNWAWHLKQYDVEWDPTLRF